MKHFQWLKRQQPLVALTGFQHSITCSHLTHDPYSHVKPRLVSSHPSFVHIILTYRTCQNTSASHHPNPEIPVQITCNTVWYFMERFQMKNTSFWQTFDWVTWSSMILCHNCIWGVISKRVSFIMSLPNDCEWVTWTRCWWFLATLFRTSWFCLFNCVVWLKCSFLYFYESSIFVFLKTKL